MNANYSVSLGFPFKSTLLKGTLKNETPSSADLRWAPPQANPHEGGKHGRRKSRMIAGCGSKLSPSPCYTTP